MNSDEKQIQLEKKKERNRNQAKKSRENKKRKIKELEDKVINLEKENFKLKLFKKYMEEHIKNELSLLAEINKLDLPKLN